MGIIMGAAGPPTPPTMPLIAETIETVLILHELQQLMRNAIHWDLHCRVWISNLYIADHVEHQCLELLAL
jgi:hypothetical protein